MQDNTDKLLNDKQVAKLISLSPQWVRSQRHKRKNGLNHTLTIKPVMIGKSPRYRQSDVYSWLADLPLG
ncbi:MAG: hypothetical protein CL570_04770 [Alphaproteobacteria bacterium]|nr:hypothetical protein [Alphaproteobacteria bacterium]|tara:strand:+ start:774 stop:980 length:207 start_codon:yes stop_codon:yes gene_type:complete